MGKVSKSIKKRMSKKKNKIKTRNRATRNGAVIEHQYECIPANDKVSKEQNDISIIEHQYECILVNDEVFKEQNNISIKENPIHLYQKLVRNFGIPWFKK
jgi:uncharacterized Fe-S cluster protein YjdI